MKDANYAIAGVMVGTIAITWAVGRIFGRLLDALAAVRVIVIRVCIGLVLAIVTAQAALAGGFWLLLTPVVGLLALFSLAMGAGFVWVWARGELGDET